MKKISRKIFISMFSFVLVFIALGTSTFAWFTMGTEASVDGLEISVSSGEALEISLGYNSSGQKVESLGLLQWKTRLNPEDISHAIGNSLKMDAVTTTDGINFFKDTFGLTTEEANGGDYNQIYVRIPIYFRAIQVENETALTNPVSVYLVDYNSSATYGNADNQSGTFIVSEGRTWEADVNFTDVGTTAAGTITTGTRRTAGDSITVKASESARLGFIKVDSTAMNIQNTEAAAALTEATMFDFTQEKENGYYVKGARKFGFVDFYKAKVLAHMTEEEANTYIDSLAKATAPTYVSGDNLSTFNADSGIALNNNSLVVELKQTESNTGIYIGKCYMCFWIEGWDADNFDVIFLDKMKVSLAFKLGYKAL